MLFAVSDTEAIIAGLAALVIALQNLVNTIIAWKNRTSLADVKQDVAAGNALTGDVKAAVDENSQITSVAANKATVAAVLVEEHRIESDKRTTELKHAVENIQQSIKPGGSSH